MCVVLCDNSKEANSRSRLLSLHVTHATGATMHTAHWLPPIQLFNNRSCHRIA